MAADIATNLGTPAQPQSGTRLYVGGLPHDIRPEQVAQRFQPFGTVRAVELIPEKEGDVSASHPAKPCRGFAYVQLLPKDDASLRRCVSMYNGCKWMGGVLRVEPAKMHYTKKHQDEEDAELAAQNKIEEEVQRLQSERAEKPAAAEDSKAPAQLKILRRDGKKVMVQANRAKTYFPPMKAPPAARLLWDPVEPPPGNGARIHRASAAPTAGSVQKGHKQPDPEPNAAPSKEVAAPAKQHLAEPEVEAAAEVEEPKSESSEELGAVDFLMSEDEMPHKAALHADSRFDSSDEDEAGPANAASFLQQPRSEAVVPIMKQQSGPQPVAAQLMQPAATAAIPELSRLVDEAGTREAPKGMFRDSAAGNLQGFRQSECSAGEETGEEGHAMQTDAGATSSSSSSQLEIEQDALQETDSKQPANVRGLHTMHATASVPAADTLDQGHVSDEGSSSSSGDEEDGSLGMQTQEAAMEEDLDDDEVDAEEQHEPGTLPRGLGDVAQKEQDASIDKDLVEEGGIGTQQETGVSSAAAIAGQDELRSSRPASLTELVELFPCGAAFCRRASDGDAAEAAWRANREQLVADYKSKRRTALRKLPSSKRGRRRI